jgi:hypothetical protein
MVWELLNFEFFFVIENSINLKIISLSSKPSFYSYPYLLLNVPKAGYKVPNFVPNGSNEILSKSLTFMLWGGPMQQLLPK